MIKYPCEGRILKRNIFTSFLNKVEDFPLWVKQVICLKLSEDIKAQVCEKFLKENADNIFSLYEPILTFKGREALMKKSSGLDLNLQNFLSHAESGYNIMEISLNTFLSMEEIAKYFIFCIDQGFIEKPENIEIEAMAGFIAGKFRTGEYFAAKGAITEDQLEEAVSKSSASQKKFAEILVDMRLISQEDVKAMLTFKQESKRRFNEGVTSHS